jgi:NADP-dependent 3-hydroxy acid dehydrogenase YdfG
MLRQRSPRPENSLHQSHRRPRWSVLGIGEATVRTLAATGYRIALLARRADCLEVLAAELGGGTIAIAADVTDRASVVTAAERIHDEMGADVLINNAGVMLLAPFSSDQQAEIRQMVEDLWRGRVARSID